MNSGVQVWDGKPARSSRHGPDLLARVRSRTSQSIQIQERGQDVMTQLTTRHGVPAPDFSPSTLTLPAAPVR